MEKINIFMKDQRLLILKIIQEADGSANESIIRECLTVYGHRISIDNVRTHLAWLQAQNLIKLKNLEDYYIAYITDMGIDVADGVLEVDGVRRPRRRF